MHDLQAAGARHVTMLHTRDRKVADSDAFVAPLKQASGVFIGGGRHWRLADAYLAALAIESGCTWVTTDRDYSRFPGLRTLHPLG